LCFVGTKFIRLAFALLVFLAVSVTLFLLTYNFGLIKGLNEGKLGWYIGAIVVCVILGAVAGFVAQKFAEHLLVPVAGAIGGAGVVALICTPLKMIPSWAKIIAMVLGGVGGFCIAAKLKKYIKCGVTAFIGAFLIFKGIGSIAGNFPSLAGNNMKGNAVNPIFWAYAVGIIVFGGVGMFI